MFELMIFATLMCKPCHGYELKRHLVSFNPNNNKIYPALRSMREKGYLEVSVQVQDARPNRHIYTITDAGREHFKHMLTDFDLHKAQSHDEFNLRICFSYLLEPGVLQQVLALRKEALLTQTPLATLVPDQANQDDISTLTRHHEEIHAKRLAFLEQLTAKYK